MSWASTAVAACSPVFVPCTCCSNTAWHSMAHRPSSCATTCPLQGAGCERAGCHRRTKHPCRSCRLERGSALSGAGAAGAEHSGSRPPTLPRRRAATSWQSVCQTRGCWPACAARACRRPAVRGPSPASYSCWSRRSRVKSPPFGGQRLEASSQGTSASAWQLHLFPQGVNLLTEHRYWVCARHPCNHPARRLLHHAASLRMS